jgi:AraC-like DNA-binding protein
MPIFMDLHIVPGVNAKDVADAHSMDVLMEKEHNCKCLTYWIDELRGHVFCLIDAPDKESVIELHTRAHGLTPNKIIEVEPNLVHSFLGRITDPENAMVTEKGLVILDDTSFRIIMHLKTIDEVILQHAVGKETANEIIERFHRTVNQEILKNNGREVSRNGNEMIVSFLSGEKAYSAACAINEELANNEALELRISIHAGEPVMKTDKLFGDTVQMLKRMNLLSREQVVHITSGVKELIGNRQTSNKLNNALVITPQDESFLSLLFDTLDQKFSDDHFDVEECGETMAMSKSQLYRKTIAQFGVSPNTLLKEFRLEKAREMMRMKNASVSQISFDTGFTSPSYFTKCFKSRYAMLPLDYLQLAQK